MAPLVYPQRKSARRTRVPTTNFHLKTRPWQVQPFFIHPVLPGETFTNALMKSRVVSDPVKNRLMGWWKEYFIFYVRFRDLVEGEDFKAIFTDPEANLSSYYSAADPKYFHRYGVNYLKLATNKIVENYFRADDEAPDDAEIDGLWAASIQTDNWLDSAVPAVDADAADVDIDPGTDDIIQMSEFERASRLYELLQAGMLTDMSYEDYLRTYGIKVASEEQERKPLLVRHIKQWTMPANTIVPETGAATTALTWSVDERADKNRMFKEPGFLVGLTVARPKIYLQNMTGSISGLMDTAMEWLPALMRDDPHSSLVRITPAAGPLANQVGDYVVDLRDYFLYGEQFTNVAPTADINAIPMPTAALGKRYPTLAMARAVFADSAEAGTKQFIEEDGRIDISIQTSVTDTTPSVSRLSV